MTGLAGHADARSGGRVNEVDAALPQTQCQRCGYPDCRTYAKAIVEDGAPINRCPPGGSATVKRLSLITGHEPAPLDPECGQEGPWRIAVIDESLCIGCTLCIQVCPVDAIVGASKRMHAVIAGECAACELCVPVCPMDCVLLEPFDPRDAGPDALADGASFLDAWMSRRAPRARRLYERRAARLAAAPPRRVVRTRAMVKERAVAGEPGLPAHAGTAPPDPLLPETAAADLARALERGRAGRPVPEKPAG